MDRLRTTRIFGALMLGACVVPLSGCIAWSPEADAEHGARQGLASLVEESQDRIWESRVALTQDPEAAVATIPGLADVRRGSAEGTWLLTDLRQDASGTALTLTASAGGEAGGGLFFQQATLRTCWTLLVAPEGSRVDTASADCAERLAAGRFPEGLAEAKIMPFDDLDVRHHVDESDYPAAPCQCSSGEPCDCPGG